MTLARPDLLGVGLLLGVALALALAVQARRISRLRATLGEEAARRLLPVRAGRVAVRLGCVVVGSATIAFAAAGPAPTHPEPAPPEPPLDLAVVVDVSLSMTADDVEPTRIARAREVIVELSQQLPSTRIALVVFAEWPYTLVPLTEDAEVVRYFAQLLEPEVVPERHQGTSLSTALALARRTLDARPREGARQAVLVLSDGGSHEATDEIVAAARAASQGGVPVWVGALGTTRGAELGSVEAPVLDTRGVAVVAALDAGLLRAVADAGGGRYEEVGAAGGVRSLVSGLAGAGEAVIPSAVVRGGAELWLLLLALPVLLWEGALDAGRGLPKRRTWREADLS